MSNPLIFILGYILIYLLIMFVMVLIIKKGSSRLEQKKQMFSFFCAWNIPWPLTVPFTLVVAIIYMVKEVVPKMLSTTADSLFEEKEVKPSTEPEEPRKSRTPSMGQQHNSPLFDTYGD